MSSHYEAPIRKPLVVGSKSYHDVTVDVAKLAESNRMYHLLEHVGTKPNVFYHVKVRNN